MTDPRNAIQDGIYDALNGASVTAYVNPEPGDDLPYTVFGGGTGIPGPLTTKTSEGAEVTHSLVSWAEDPDVAQAKGSTGLDALTDRAAPIAVTGYTLVRCDLDFLGELIKDDTDEDDVRWGSPYRVRIVVKQN